MTKKHYQAIAGILRDYDDLNHNEAVMLLRRLALDLADYFATDNPRFDRERFLSACGVRHKHETHTEIDPETGEEIDWCDICGGPS